MAVTGIFVMMVATVLSCANPMESAKSSIVGQYEISPIVESGNKEHPEEKQQLQGVSDRYDRVVRVLGENAVDDAVQQDIQEQKALEEKRQMEQMPTGSIHERLAWGARKSSRKAALWQSKNRVLG